MEKIFLETNYNFEQDVLVRVTGFVDQFDKAVIIITGPTGSGKTSLAHLLSLQINSRLISADSRQIYKGLNIGSNKPEITGHSIMDGFDTAIAYDQNQNYLYWHLNEINLDQEFSVQKYREQTREMFVRLHDQKIIPIVVGGSMHWIKMLISPTLSPYYISDEKLYLELCDKSMEDLQKQFLDLYGQNNLNESDWNNSRRLSRAIEFKIITGKSLYDSTKKVIDQNKYLIFQINIDREIHRQKLRESISDRIQNGWIQEVEEVLKNYPENILDKLGLGYRLIGKYILEGKKKSLDELIEEIVIAEMRYAKKQKINA